MSDATTPANPTDQIAATPAVLSPEPPIVPTSGTKRVPDDSEAAVVQDAQQYDWRTDMDVIESCDDMSECADGCCTYFTPRHNDECIRLAAHIEYLEDLLNGYRGLYDDAVYESVSLKAERDALLAEHEAWIAFVASGRTMDALTAFERAHDNADGVIRG